MENNIPINGTELSDTVTDKDPMALLIMHKAYLDVFGDEESEENKEDGEKEE